MKESISPLTIAMVTDDFLPAKTGVGVHVQKIAGELMNRGHRIVVITTRRKGQPTFEEYNGVRIHRVRSFTIAGYPQAIPTSASLQNIILDENVNVVHFHYLSYLMWLGLRVARGMGLKTLYTAHMSVDLLVSPPFMKPFLPVFTKLYFGILEMADHVLCPSEVQTRQVNQFTAHPQVHRVSNPIEFNGSESQDTTRSDRFVVLFVGRLSPEKNLVYLINAFERLSAVDSTAELWIAGQGVLDAELRRIVRERGLEKRIIFKGQVPHDQLPGLYTACDVFFLPSLREILALVGLEAMRFSRPLIVTDRIICAKELVENNVNGWIVDADRVEDGAEKLMLLSRDRELGKRMGKKGFERSLTYTLPVIGDQIERLYSEIDEALKGGGVQVQRRHTCALCHRGTFAEARESNVLQADARNLPDEFFRMWRCPACFSLHSLVHVKLADLDRPSPYIKRKMNIFNRQMFAGFYRFLRREGLKPTDRLLFYGLSADLFKTVFESMGQSTVDIVDKPLSAEAMAVKPAGDYDAVVVMEHLECAEDPRSVFAYVSRQLRPGGLLIIHTPDAKRITLDAQASWRLHQPYRIHILSKPMLESLSRAEGFQTKAIYHRNHMDTPWPFINFHAFHELPFFGDGTLDAAIEFRPIHLLRAWWRWPRFFFWGLVGGIIRDKSNLVGVFHKANAHPKV